MLFLIPLVPLAPFACAAACRWAAEGWSRMTEGAAFHYRAERTARVAHTVLDSPPSDEWVDGLEEDEPAVTGLCGLGEDHFGVCVRCAIPAFPACGKRIHGEDNTARSRNRVRKTYPYPKVVAGIINQLTGTELGRMADTPANRLVVERRVCTLLREHNVRYSDAARLRPQAVELYFVPAQHEIEARAIGRTRYAQRLVRDYHEGGPAMGWFTRAVMRLAGSLPGEVTTGGGGQAA